MRRYLSVIVLAAFCAGCAGPQRTPDATVLQSLQTVAIVPLADHAPTSTTSHWYSARPVGMEAVAVAALLVVFAPLILASYATKAAAIPEGALTLEREPQSDSARLTVALARAAAETLQVHGARTAYLVDGYLRLPMADATTSPADIQFEKRTRFLRWYAEKVARVDYSGMSTEGIDAILEVGVSEFEHRDNALILQVQVRLVNPVTKEVLGRASHRAVHAVDPSPTTFRSFFRFRRIRVTPEQLDALAKDKGRESILECLKVLGLLVE